MSQVSYLELGLGCRLRDCVVFLRPGLSEFLEFLFQNFEVIIWTSMKKRRALDVLKFVLGPELKPARILSREHCTFVPDLATTVTDGQGSSGAVVGFKILGEAIWRSPEITDILGFIPTRRNTVLVVDKPISGLLNPALNCVFVSPFTSAIRETLPTY